MIFPLFSYDCIFTQVFTSFALQAGSSKSNHFGVIGAELSKYGNISLLFN